MKKIIIPVFVFFTISCYSQNIKSKISFAELKTVSKKQDTTIGYFTNVNKPVLSHFGLKATYNDSVSTLIQNKKMLKPKLLMVSILNRKKDSISKN